MGKPKTPDIPDPARRPERKETLTPEDIEIGRQEDEELYKKGRKALRRPSAGSSSGGGVGLMV